MRNRKRASNWLAMFAVMAMLVAACGEGGGGEGADTTESPDVTEASSDTTAPDDGGTDTTAAAEGSSEPVVVCELAYYTGEFAPYGPSLTADVVFPVEQVINEDPPLGRTWDLYHEDLGGGEAQAARTCLEQHSADILVSPAHGYRTYRDFIVEWVEENDGPLMPTVHGGTIPGNLGGTAEEPIFRAQGLDEGLGMSGVLYAEDIGAESIVIFATQVEGFQIAADAAEKGAEAAGIEVLARIDVPAEQPSYRAEAERIADLAPDAVIVQAGSVESGTLINQAAEAGASLEWIGETGWIQQEFIGTLGTEPISSQQGIGYAAFSYNADTPAWDFYQPLWDDTPGYGDEFGPATDQYHFSTYDLMVHTALAVEAGGSYNASDWAPAMHEVGEAPGEVCYTYSECLELIRAGEDVDYQGVTGPADYTEGGVNAVVQSYTPFLEDGTAGEGVALDPDRFLELLTDIAVQAECDEDNNCEW